MNLYKQMRNSLNLTQKEFGKLIGVTESMVSRYENHTRYPSFKVLLRLNYLAKKHKIEFDLDEFH